MSDEHDLDNIGDRDCGSPASSPQSFKWGCDYPPGYLRPTGYYYYEDSDGEDGDREEVATEALDTEGLDIEGPDTKGSYQREFLPSPEYYMDNSREFKAFKETFEGHFSGESFVKLPDTIGEHLNSSNPMIKKAALYVLGDLLIWDDQFHAQASHLNTVLDLALMPQNPETQAAALRVLKYYDLNLIKSSDKYPQLSGTLRRCIKLALRKRSVRISSTLNDVLVLVQDLRDLHDLHDLRDLYDLRDFYVYEYKIPWSPDYLARLIMSLIRSGTY